MIKKIRESLMLKIFLIVCVLLILISAITYAAVARFLPVTYANRLKEDIDVSSQNLARQIEQCASLEEAEGLIELFEAGLKVTVMIQDQNGTIVRRPTEVIVAVDEGDSWIEYSEAQVTYEYQTEISQGEGGLVLSATEWSDAGTQGEYFLDTGGAVLNFSVAVNEYALKVNGEPYTMRVSGGLQPVNQAVEVLKEIFPYILALVLAASFLIALGASRYLTRLKDEIELERELDRRHLAFFSAVSHELKTPVTILEGHLAGMLEGVGEYRNREYYLKRSLRTVQNMRGLVGELLTVSRIEDKPPAMQKTDLAELLRLQLAEYTELIEQKEIALTADLPDHCFAESCSPMMEKVFCNLLMNAIRYTPGHAGNRIRIRMEPGEARDSLRFQIENTGVQIPQESLPHLFEAFYRVEQSRSRETGGSGLGLYIVRLILDRHGARYRIENTSDGVAFSVEMQTGRTETAA